MSFCLLYTSGLTGRLELDGANKVTIGTDAFKDCNSFTDLKISNVDTVDAATLQGINYKEFTGKLELNNVRKVDDNLFKESKFTSLSMTGVSVIGATAFEG